MNKVLCNFQDQEDIWDLFPGFNRMRVEKKYPVKKLKDAEEGFLEGHTAEDSEMVRIPAPGFTLEDIDVTFKDNILNVKICDWEFSENFEKVDPSKIDAELKLGILTINLGLKKESKPIKIKVSEGGED